MFSLLLGAITSHLNASQSISNPFKINGESYQRSYEINWEYIQNPFKTNGESDQTHCQINGGVLSKTLRKQLGIHPNSCPTQWGDPSRTFQHQYEFPLIFLATPSRQNEWCPHVSLDVFAIPSHQIPHVSLLFGAITSHPNA